MTLNKKWQDEWDNIEIPHDKMNQMITETVKKMPENQKRTKKINFKSPIFTFAYGAVAAGAVAFMFLNTPAQLTTLEAPQKEVKSEMPAENAAMNPEVGNSANLESKVAADEKGQEHTQESTQKLVTQYQIFKQSKELKTDYDTILELIKTHQGVVANSDTNFGQDNYPSAHLSVNIPTDKIDLFLEGLDRIAKTTSSSKNQYDVTTEYVDNESRIKALETEEKALLELLEKSNQVEDMIKVQERLSVVRSEREELVRGNKTLDKQVDYTTVDIYLDGVEKTTPQKSDSIWERVKLNWQNQKVNLKNFAENILVFMMSYGVYLIIVSGLGYLIFRKVKKK